MEGNSLETFQFEREDLERAVQEFLRLHGAALLRAARETAASLSRGGKVLFFGNGGSAAEAQHLSAELVNRMTRDRPALAAVALSTDTSALTSIANDSSYEQVFSRQIEALGKSGDVAVALSTSGNSPNIVRGLEAAKRKGLLTVALLGRDGGLARALAEIPLVVEAPVTARIQEVHLFAGHLFCEAVERVLFPALRPPD
ncbi:MAG: D-sedoheptulose 7-phosphate isomerase [Acidobacteria bacterium]|nr:D-sedoheptulose 7-phosphate isomerase [Acidobacteriota bacterium]